MKSFFRLKIAGGPAIAVFVATAFVSGCAKPTSNSTPNTATTQKASPGACVASFPIAGLCVHMTWEVAPAEGNEGQFLFYYTSQAAIAPVVSDEAGITSKVKLWMPSMGHGSSPITVERIQGGVMRAKDVNFIMEGDWELHFERTLPNGQTEKAIYAFVIKW